MDEFLGADGWLTHQRESWVWMRDRFIPYPFQNNIRHLPPADLDKCLQGLVEITRHPRRRPEDFGQWIDATFGPGLAEVFMRPYNFKVWAYPPEKMNSSWVGERVAVTDLGRVLHNIAHAKDDLSWGPNNTFKFPKSGGTGAIWTACAAQLPQGKIQFNQNVTAVDLLGHKVHTADGRILSYSRLISTLPLKELVKMSGQEHYRPLTEHGLLHSSSNIIGIGLSGQPPESLKTKCWLYFPENNCPFYRVTIFSNYSPANVPNPDQQWSLMAEVSESMDKKIDQTTLLEEVIQGLINTRLITRREAIVSTWCYRACYGYPTPSLHRDETLAELLPFFERHDVYSRGRFGAWKYEVSNQDHSFMQGVEVVEQLLNKNPEITVTDAPHANSKHHPWPFERWQ